MAALLPVDVPWGQQKPPYGVQVNREHPLLSEGGSVWLFNESAGATAYDGLGKNNGTFNNSGVTWQTSQKGKVVDFPNTVGSCINLGTPASLNFQIPFFVASYAMLRTPTNDGGVVTRYKSTSSSQLLFILGWNATEFAFYCSKSDGTYQRNAYSSTPAAKTWHLLTAVVQGTVAAPTLRLGLDGIEQTFSLAALSSTPDYTVPVIIGGNDISGVVGNAYWNGQQDFVIMGSFAPSSSQIQQLYANPYDFMQPRRLWVPMAGGTVATYLTRRTQVGLGTRAGSRKVAA